MYKVCSSIFIIIVATSSITLASTLNSLNENKFLHMFPEKRVYMGTNFGFNESNNTLPPWIRRHNKCGSLMCN